jgi:hypothetical protein
MSVTFSRVLSIASLPTTDEVPRSLLTLGTANPKVGKGEKRGYRTAILHLSPANAAGFEVCAGRTAGCTAACLNTAGRGGMDTAAPSAIHVARLRRTKLFKRDREAFGFMLRQEIHGAIRSANRHGLTPVVRLNGTSDLPWENVRWDGATIFETFPDVQFYDYTKVVSRLRKPIPSNYDLTFSLADGNDADALEALDRGYRVAAVFGTANPGLNKWPLPSHYMGRPVIDADETDLRFLDDPGVICGLRAKGLAKHDTTGFVKFV